MPVRSQFYGVRARILLAALLLFVGIGAAVWLWQRRVDLTPPPPEVTTTTQPPPVSVSNSTPLVAAPDSNTLSSAKLDPAVEQLAAKLLDPARPLIVRRRTAQELAKLGTDSAVAALRAGLTNAVPYLKAGIAESLGECTNAAARGLLLELVRDPDPIVARAAVRGLALSADPGVVATLGELLTDAQQPMSVRTEAALALGDVNVPAAFDLLTQAAYNTQDEVLVEYIMEGIAKRNFAETEEFLNRYLASETPASLKAAAIEALGSAEGDVAPLLLKLLNHTDPEIRAAAAWALNTVDSAGANPQLADALRQERDAKVRLRLYQALDNGGALQAGALLEFIQKEPDGDARLAGLRYLAGTFRNIPDPAVVDYFTRTAVAELKGIALGSTDLECRLTSTIALGRTGLPEANRALEEIYRQSNDPIVRGAADRILAPRR
jgi:HEAT repeat protein